MILSAPNDSVNEYKGGSRALLDLKFIRENIAVVKEALIKRMEFTIGDELKTLLAEKGLLDPDTAENLTKCIARPDVLNVLLEEKDRVSVPKLDAFLDLDGKRRNSLKEVEELRYKKNEVSKEIGKIKSSGRQPDPAVFREMKEISNTIKSLELTLKEVKSALDKLLLSIPNMPLSTTPVGGREDHNVEVRVWGEKREFDFTPLDHREIGERLGILDFERGAKITGARFPLYLGAGALLERALINYMLDVHTREHGYKEILPPFLVNRDSMTGTGQLPKLEDDMFHTNMDYFLIPTGEVPVTNIHREEILPPGTLPLYFVAYTPCFRLEAGAAGQDTKGLIRVHQFNKVEMVKLVEPGTSSEELENLLKNAELILQRLEIPYRVLNLCSGDISFAAAKCYDIELWVPSQNRYREVSSCSTFEDFQARRANIRYRPEKKAKPRYVHTLNGSGLSVGRTVVAILENYQQKDGSVVVPKVLRPYMNELDIIS